MGDDELERRIGHRFQRPELLRQALTHRSFRHEQLEAGVAAADDGDNERLEFLGDAVLGLRACERLIEVYPASPEGQLSRLRAFIVSARNLAAAAQQLNLGAELRLSHAEDAIGGRAKPRLLANAMEAVIAALYLDGGYAAAAGFIDRFILDGSMERLPPGALHEFAFKSALQEWAHAAGRPAPVYRVLRSTGPEHEKTFTIEVSLGGLYSGTATGTSKKAAEQLAAAAALAFLGVLPRPELIPPPTA